jgi:precorrin-6Y C5,15-methyltransferase (decarboxylating)
MAKIVLFGGTVEGRKLAELFAHTKLELYVCVATAYGGELLSECENIHVHVGRMDETQIEAFLNTHNPEYCLDATHPYAAVVTRNIRLACEAQNIPYIRILREEGKTDVPVIYCENVGQAVEFLKTTTGNILITTGSRDLESYTHIENYQNRCAARVLPTVEVIEKCRQLGFEGKNLIAMQGPFDEELNYCLLRQTHAEWLVTKNSGKEGGFEEKCEAAVRAGVKLVVIGRPAEEDGAISLTQAAAFLQKHYSLQKQRKVSLIGMGPGCEAMLTGQAVKALRECDVLIGAQRILEIYPEYAKKPYFKSYRTDEIRTILQEHPEYERAALLYSGDVGFYSGAKGMADALQKDGFTVEVISGISSPVYFLNKLGIAWDETKLVSCHGNDRDVISDIRTSARVCALSGNPDFIPQVCAKLLEYHMENVKITVGERLSYPEETITQGTAQELSEHTFDSLCVVLFENPAPRAVVTPGIADTEFIREKVPMTKEEIRTLSLCKLGLKRDSVLYDIGAGTGSVCVEAAGICTQGKVYAVEQRHEAVQLIRENQRKFAADNLVVCEGAAPEVLSRLLAPTHAFIGGSGGHLLEIVAAVREKNPAVRFVVNVVTMETLGQISSLCEKFPEYADMEIIQVSVSKSRPLGRYHLMEAENPVYIISFGGKCDAE